MPNILGLAFGLVQMILYVIYKNFRKEEGKLAEHNVDNVKMNTINITICEEVQQTAQCSNENCHQNGAYEAGEENMKDN